MSDFSVPSGFLWGAATSSHQVEGGNVSNDWYDWEIFGKLKTASGRATAHYDLFEQDFDMARALGHNAHRFSIEWSRIEPEENEIHEDVLDHYHSVVKALRARDLEPIVTLHHFTLPRWIVRMGGWTVPETVEHFQKYVERVARVLGDSVRYWVTINEPLVLVYCGYIERKWPPGIHSFDDAEKAIVQLIRAHTAAYYLLHKMQPHCRVSMAKHLRIFDPFCPYSPLDRLSAWLRDFLFNHLMLEVCVKGSLLAPGMSSEDRRRAKGTMDFIGVNYYTRDLIQFKPGGFLYGSIRLDADDSRIKERNSLGWEVYAKGLYRLLLRMKRYKLPILILENGICTEVDERRSVFIQKHIESMYRAMQQGVNVRGYFHWSLMDNFEWADGFEPKFGLAAVDYKTMKRMPRPSAFVFKKICETGAA